MVDLHANKTQACMRELDPIEIIFVMVKFEKMYAWEKRNEV